MDNNNFAVLMAGGVGSRFWPVSTTSHPKQFRDLLGTGETLIQTTYKRLNRLVPAENIFILTNEIYKELVQQQLPGLSAEQIVLEPVMRNTAPAVLLAALKIYKKNRDAVMIMAPSDHWIEDEAAFIDDVELGFKTCREDKKIITLGIKPTFPNTGYGYIQYEETAEKVKAVKNFTEKPSFEVARNFIAQGNYDWNAGIFIWSAGFILDSFRRNLPEMFSLFSKGEEEFNSVGEAEFIKENYSAAENISIDYGILEKENNIFVISAGFDWNDLGTWGSLYNELDKDSNKNAVLEARLLARNSRGNIVSSDSGKVVVLDDLENYIVIDEKEVLLIVPKEKEQEIKQIRGQVQQDFGNHLG
ncbi:mannose-1-phosphate guanylyltransferase [Salinimicrobium sp. GXAS 041]|uniref:mannose-1-phosphate guanylyltransferase n=1 Tax=Salinimicrobium sp. GXAS 041 TaxID=3400806 RepID=UPI003C7627C3